MTDPAQELYEAAKERDDLMRDDLDWWHHLMHTSRQRPTTNGDILRVWKIEDRFDAALARYEREVGR